MGSIQFIPTADNFEYFDSEILDEESYEKPN